MKQTKGTLSYTISYDNENFNIMFEEMDEIDQVKNALASVSFAKIISEQMIEDMDTAKKENKDLYKEKYKSNSHNLIRLQAILKELQIGCIRDLVEMIKEPNTIVTIQNEIKDK